MSPNPSSLSSEQGTAQQGVSNRAELDMDSLTGIPSPKQYEHDLLVAISNAQREGLPLALLMFDVDDFKQINSRLTHEGGDEALRLVAQSLSKGLKGKGSVYRRYNGDEFVALLPNHDLTEAAAVAVRLREGVAALKHSSGASITVTVGVSAYPEPTRDASVLYRNADQLLMDGKSRGEKNQVHAGIDLKIDGVSTKKEKSPSSSWVIEVTVIPRSKHPIAKHKMLDEIISSSYSVLLGDFGERIRRPLYRDRSNYVVDQEAGWVGAMLCDKAWGLSKRFEISVEGCVRLVLSQSYVSQVRAVQSDRILEGLIEFWPFLDRFSKLWDGNAKVTVVINGIAGALLSVNQQLTSKFAINWIAKDDNYATDFDFDLPAASAQERNLFFLQIIHAVCSAFSPPGGVSVRDLREQFIDSFSTPFLSTVQDISKEDE